MKEKKITVRDALLILHLGTDCTEEDIKKSYRRLSLITHPDTPGGDAKKFLVIKEAYDALKGYTYKATTKPSKVVIFNPNLTIERVKKVKGGYEVVGKIINIKEIIIGKVYGFNISLILGNKFVLNENITVTFNITSKDMLKLDYALDMHLKGADNQYYEMKYNIKKPKFYERWF